MTQKTPKECYDEYLAASENNVPLMKGLVDTHLAEASSASMITPVQARDAFISALKEMAEINGVPPEAAAADIEKARTDINERIKQSHYPENAPAMLWLVRKRVHSDIDAENTKWLSGKAKECNYAR
jgi:ribonuclease HIII